MSGGTSEPARAGGAGRVTPWREAVTVLEAWARALAKLERKGLGDAPLGPDDLVSEPEPRIVLVGKAPSARFTPPEQIDGAPWDASARRYVLGLAAYRLLSGALPFAGEGLRRDVEERATRGVPPFPEEIAETLKPGVQSLVLRILSPKPSERPRSADEIARECRALLSETSPGKRRREPARLPAVREPAKVRIGPAIGKKRDRIIAAAIVIAGMLVATLAAFARPSASTDEKPVHISAVTLHGTQAQDCAGCHPREVSEWKRSVMAHASKSPLFGALESAVEEQIGRTSRCPLGAGVLRPAGADACFDDRSGNKVTGSGGEGWCINCHAIR